MLQHTRTFIPALARFFIILTGNFPTIFITIMMYQSFRFTDSAETIFGIHFYTYNRIDIRTSPIKINSSIIILKEGRIMLTISQLCIHFFPSIFFRMSILINSGISTGSGKVKCITINKNCRRIILHSRNSCTRNIFPLCQVFRAPVTTGLGSKHIIISFEIFQYRIGSFTS